MLKPRVYMLALLALAVGCSARRGPKLDPTPPVEAVKPETKAPPVEKVAPALTVGTEWGEVPILEPAYFDTGRAELSNAARQTLKRNGAILKVLLKEVPGLEVRVEGHCDERATLEYNIALGQTRSTAVKNYYTALSIPKAALSTVSFGEERPVCTQSEESCWKLNRRGVTVIRAKGPIQVPLNKLPQ